VRSVIHGLQADMADAVAYPGGERLGVQVVTTAYRFEQCDAGGRHPQPGATQLRCAGRRL